jgi:hypothetical protein
VPALYGKSRQVSETLKDLGKTNGGPYSRIHCYECHPVPHGAVVARKDAVIEAGGYQETSTSGKSVLEDFFSGLE